MTTIEVLFVANDAVVELRDLVEETTGDPVSGATVEAVVKDSGGDTKATVSMSEVAAGHYRGLLQHNTPLVAGGRYTVTITVDGGVGRHAQWTVPARAQTRG